MNLLEKLQALKAEADAEAAENATIPADEEAVKVRGLGSRHGGRHLTMYPFRPFN